jgi:DNA-binding NtrC family response regulator
VNVPPPSVLIVDDDDTFRSVLARELKVAGLRVATRSRGEEVEAALIENTYDVVMLDLRMPGMDGIATLNRIKEVRGLTEVVILTGHGSVESAVQALKLGAYDFLTKPCNLDHLESTIRRAAEARAMRSENAALRRTLDRAGTNADLIGRSPAMEQVRALIEKVAPTNSTVLIRGESGTGKEVIARTIHRLHPRSERPFVVLDCGSTEEGLVLSELFGHEKGAYTGAGSRKHGLFEVADSGTILIDEIGDAPMTLQTRLLRVLETGTFRRLGAEESIPVDVRILSATHRDLEALVKEGSFREDLYYRLNVFRIDVPPLRERIEDIEPLVAHFVASLCPGSAPTVNPEASQLLRDYPWPGNARELRNVIERALILSGGDTIRPEHLPANLAGEATSWNAGSDEAPIPLHEVERRYIMGVLDRYHGNREEVAAALGISERTLYRKLRSHADRSPRQS